MTQEPSEEIASGDRREPDYVGVSGGVAGETSGLVTALALGAHRRFTGASDLTRAILLMVFASFVFNMMNAVIRHVSADLHPFEIGFFRNVFGLVALSPLYFRHGLGVLKTTRIGMHATRAGFNVISMMCFFYALSITPLAEVASMGFTLPIFVTIFAAIFLGERLRARRLVALAVGLCGALIIVRPGAETMEAGPLIVLAGTALWAVSIMVIKSLSRTDSPLTITSWASISLAVLSFPMALAFWKMPDLEQFAWLAAIGVMGSVGAMATAHSLRLAEATALMPYDFVKLLWAALIGFAVFGEVPSPWTWVGAAIIFASTLYLTYREAAIRRERELLQ